jgi:F-type H+-transporting ATPase subunit delta
MRNTRVARRYALALMTAAEGQQSKAAIATDVGFIGNLIRSSRDLRLLLTSPIVSIPRKRSVLHEILKGRVQPMTLSFIDLLVTKQREALLDEIADQFLALHDERQGIVNVNVTTAVALSAEQQRTLTTALEQQTKKKVRVNTVLDPAIKGGLRVRIADTVVDATVTHKLERLRLRFIHGTART